MPIIQPLDIERIHRSKPHGARIAFISGNFNVIHAGHMRLFKFAADASDILIVGIHPDGASGVTMPLNLRIEALRAINFVHDIHPLTEKPEEFIAKLKPDLVVKGKEFETQQNPEEAAVAAYGGKLLFSSGEMRFSSMDLLQRDFSPIERSSVSKPVEYPIRHGFPIKDLLGILNSFSGMRVMVLGDLIVDDYVNCDPLGMSQEDPTIVVTPIDKRTFVGGAGIVAAHAHGLGAEVRFLTVGGKDKLAKYAAEKLGEFGVKAMIVGDATRPTTLKARYRANGKTLLRINELRQHAVAADVQRKMFAWVKRHISTTDLILFADFNYGCLPQSLVVEIEKLANRHGVMMAADSQASSQLSDISRFTGMAVVTPTEREARLALQDFESGIAVIGSRLRKKSDARNVIVTMGGEGLLVIGDKDGTERLDKLPAFNSAPKDVAGAGDSLFTCISMSLRAGYDIWRSAYLASLAASIQVSRVGNIPLQASEIEAELADRRG
jgi:rfaE bifunctional protein kinase chain/domain